MLPSAGHFWRRWASGSRVRCRFICISIPRGPTPIRLLRWRCFSGIGFARAASGPGCNGRSSVLIGGLMMDVYYVSGVLLLLPLFESLARHIGACAKGRRDAGNRRAFFSGNVVFRGRARGGVPADADHQANHLRRLPTIRATSISGTGLPRRSERCAFPPITDCSVGPRFCSRLSPAFSCCGAATETWPSYLILVFAAVLYTHRLLPDLGRPFFLRKPLLHLADAAVRAGLAAFFEWLARAWTERRAMIVVRGRDGSCCILWNLGLIFQWGTHLIPARGPISWREAAYNQVAVVPAEASQTLKNYLTDRRGLMDHIEQEDVDAAQDREQEQGNPVSSVSADGRIAAPSEDSSCCASRRQAAGGRFPLASCGATASCSISSCGATSRSATSKRPSARPGLCSSRC